MERISKTIVKRRKLVLAVFGAAFVLCAILQLFVGVNYNMVDYLPETAQSTKALDIMEAEFTQFVPNASVMVKEVSLPEAMDYKDQLLRISGVSEVLWLDDMVDIMEPLEMQDTETVEGFYKNGTALFSVTIEEGMESETCAAIRAMIGPENAVSGEAADTAFTQDAVSSEALNAMAILMPVIILILICSTSSWIEPLLFLTTIGVSIVLNMGTGIIFGEVSFMTNSVSPILQIAVSLDYAIFLLHSFAANRSKYKDVKEAMRHAVKESVTTVAASASTTLFGFMALVFMEFGIGADLGLALAKGIIISFICAIVFLPALTLCAYKWIDRAMHRPFMPRFETIYKVVSKVGIPVVAAVVIMLVPGYLGQQETSFIYGNGDPVESTRTGQEAIAVRKEFGQSTVMALLVPRGEVAKEVQLGRELKEHAHVTGVMSYAATVGEAIPTEFLSDDIVGQFYSENYSRIILYTDTPEEGDLAFAVVEEIYEIVDRYYEEYYAAGQSANLYDMRNVVKKDNTLVNLVAVIAIFGVLLVTFKSLTLPFILLLTIEAGIWINLAIPYFSGITINFIGYLVVNTVQLGATVDYAILLTDHYRANRREMPAKQAMTKAMGESFKSILVSAATLATAGFVLYFTSSNVSISDIGLLLGRGTVMSFVMVVCFLPALLRIFDRAINKTTYKAGFYIEKKAHLKGGTASVE